MSVELHPRRWPIAFRIFAEPKTGSRLHFAVRVFPDRRAAWRDAKAHGCLADEPRAFWNWSALTHGHSIINTRRHGPSRITPEIGVLWFGAKELGAGVAGHEIMHAALRWAERRRVAFVQPPRKAGEFLDASPAEERVCHVVGWLTAQFWDRLYRHGRIDVVEQRT